ncbi:MAG: TIGR00300 family protein [Coriobacteriia bacterium]|nr:TIGR00300 family protein [Coriobacteriia bacterium]
MPAGRPFEDVRVEGHLIDSGIVSHIMDDIMDLEGEFETLRFDVGRTNEDTSVAELRVFGKDETHLAGILIAIQEHGAVPLDPGDAVLQPAPADGVFPDDFYSTTNLETFVRLSGRWVRVAYPEMDLGVRVDTGAGMAEGVPMGAVRAGDLFVVGRQGLRVAPNERPRESQAFEFMGSEVSSEKPKAYIVREVARVLRDVRGEGRDVIAVAGPAVVHTGAAGHLARLVELGYVSVLFGGNAVAVHDIEWALYGTSLGVLLEEGLPVPGGHEHHLRAVNTIRRHGGIRQAVEAGVLTKGLMHTLVATGTPFVLAGSIRDDGPLPEVITDAIEAQEAMRRHAREAGACLMLSTMLHSIATGNMLPASVHTVCVDINPAVVTKLADRGSWQTMGVVTDVGLFLEQLAEELRGRSPMP